LVDFVGDADLERLGAEIGGRVGVDEGERSAAAVKQFRRRGRALAGTRGLRLDARAERRRRVDRRLQAIAVELLNRSIVGSA
jgi:hypothetical protein